MVVDQPGGPNTDRKPVPSQIENRLFINGKFCESSDGKTFDIKSPATHELVATVFEASVEDTNTAVAAAKAAQPGWAALSPGQRGAPMKKLAALIRESHDELASLEALSMGRPVCTYFESGMAADRFEYFAAAGYDVKGSSSLNTPGFANITLKQPFGVVAVIIPWNVPLVFLSGKVAPALAAGNTVVLKSSEKAPLTSAKVATLIEKAGFPPGVINVLSGHGHISGACLSSHMDVRALSFTGSGRTGRLIQAAAAKSNLKNVILELGGKSPAIIFDDADLEYAAECTQASIQFNSGQICMANSRVYVQRPIADKFIARFKEKFSSVKKGDPLDPTTNHGPVADRTQFEIVHRYIENGKEYKPPLLGGAAHEGKDGLFIDPTIFTDIPEDAKIMKEEIFGPVVVINTFETEDEVIAKANNTEFGLYASVFTNDISRALRCAKQIEAGTVGINTTSPTTAADLPFGGWKSSGVGHEGLHESLDNFLETKTVLFRVG